MGKSKLFPWRQYDKETLLLEFDKLREISSKEIKKSSLLSNIGRQCTNSFFQYVRMDTPTIGSHHLTSIEFWRNKREKIIHYRNSKSKGKDLFGTIVFLNKAPSQFSVITSCWIYQKFNVSSVFDPFSGWGERLLAAMAMDIDYVGCDSNKKLYGPYSKMIKFFGNYSKSDVLINIGRCEKIIQLKHMRNREFDMFFSSPPFFTDNGKLLEEYDGTEEDENTFFETCLIPVIEYGFSHCKHICLQIPKNMYIKIRKVFGKADKKFCFGRKRSYDTQNYEKNNFLFYWKMK